MSWSFVLQLLVLAFFSTIMLIALASAFRISDRGIKTGPPGPAGPCGPTGPMGRPGQPGPPCHGPCCREINNRPGAF